MGRILSMKAFNFLGGRKRISHEEVKRAVKRSQHCQRNWDLSKAMPEKDIELIEFALKTCPSKQNIAFYDAYTVTDRAVIEKIHDATDGFIYNFENSESVTNSQTLANLVVVFAAKGELLASEKEPERNEQTWNLKNNPEGATADHKILERDAHMAVGVAAGYINLLGSLLGYRTGCCACFDDGLIKQALSMEVTPLLIMGIGFHDPERARREHHLMPDFVFPTKRKQEIKVTRISD